MLELAYRSRQLERMSRSLQRGSQTGGRAAEWDRMTFGDWLRHRVHAREARALLQLVAQLKLAAEPEETSLFCLLEFLRASGGLLTRERFAHSGAEEVRLRGGAQTLCTALAAQLGEKVRLREAVERVEQTPPVEVRLRTNRGAWRARRLVLALPPGLAGRISFSPELSAAHCELRRRAQMGPIIKCALAYPHPFWRESGFSGEAYDLAGDVRAVTDDCSEDCSHAGLAAFVVGARARVLSELPAAERRTRVIEGVSRLFGEPAREIEDYREMDWLADEWSRGCVTWYPPGILAAHRSALSAPCGLVHFAGSEAAQEWHGHLEGAAEAGERAADEVLIALGARQVV
jgi:monoamine oxidase